MDALRWHSLEGAGNVEPPRQFTYPFHYVPHQLAVTAAKQVQHDVARQTQWADELRAGKMLGVLVARNQAGHLGFLAAYSGLLNGSNDLPYFVPPIHDLLAPDGEFKQGEAQIDAINREIDTLEASPALQALHDEWQQALGQRDEAVAAQRQIIAQAKNARDARRVAAPVNSQEAAAMERQSQHLKAELRRIKQRHKTLIDEIENRLSAARQRITALKRQRRAMSEALQERIFRLFVVENARGEQRDLVQIFAEHNGTLPPAGAGECCAPKLLHHAYQHHLQPLCMAEFWWGESPAGEVRHHGHFYPACRSKCLPILTFMLQGLEVEPNPLATHSPTTPLPEAYDDAWLTVVVKPAGMLSVPGKLMEDSALTRFGQAHPEATGPMVVHRLDQETSGLLLFAKDKDSHQALQRQWAERSIGKRYVALLEGTVKTDEGIIDLPLRPNVDDRPRQMVDPVHGKRAVTRFHVLKRKAGRTLVMMEPLTGRTHQLRVHASHPQGLNAPIVGDMLYGTADTRLMLHAQQLTFTHPVTGKPITVTSDWNSEIPY